MKDNEREEDKMATLQHKDQMNNVTLVESDAKLQKIINWIESPVTDEDIRNSKLINRAREFYKINDRKSIREGKVNLGINKENK